MPANFDIIFSNLEYKDILQIQFTDRKLMFGTLESNDKFVFRIC